MICYNAGIAINMDYEICRAGFSIQKLMVLLVTVRLIDISS